MARPPRSPAPASHFHPVALCVIAGLALTVAALGLFGPVGLAAADETDEIRADEPRTDDATELLPERHRDWLASVALLITDAERAVFVGLREDYRRDAFIRRFWRTRDPHPETARNELRDAWDRRLPRARELYRSLDDERARLLLLFGEPSRRDTMSCEVLRTRLEIWHYFEGSDRIDGSFTLVFHGLGAGRDGARSGGIVRLWQPSDGLHSLMGFGTSLRDEPAMMGTRIREQCIRGDDVLAALAMSLDVDRVDAQTLYPPPGDEWVRTFEARSTALPEGAAELPGTLSIRFPGRNQSRTVVQALVAVPKLAATAGELGDFRSYNFLVDGEILRQGDLFEHFRYRFDMPADLPDDTIPVIVERSLRPGEYTLVLKVQDVHGKSFYRAEEALEVPRVEPTRQAVTVTADGAVETVELPAVDELLEPAPSALFDEANSSLGTGDHAVRILPLGDTLRVGRLRIEARTRGEGIDRVAFELDDRPVMAKRRPPYSVEVDLGDAPRVQTLRAIALGPDGERLADDEVLVNAGPHRFSVRLIEPQRGASYRRSVRVRAAVEVPEGEVLDRVEVFLNDTRVATLYQPPFEQPILLPPELGMTWVRAAAHLVDGASAEDVELINAPDVVDELKVQFVELYASVLDRKGRFVDDLRAEDLTVLEEGEEQSIRRFEPLRDLPIRAGLLIDTSLSMETSLRDVERAAFEFLEQVVTPRDRAAVLTFADEPELRARFTNDPEILAGALAGLVPEGETALWDALVYATHYFSGLEGKRAIVLLTDGEDSGSEYTFDEALDFARRSGVSIYVVGMGLANSEHTYRSALLRLARETGGDTFFIERATRLGKVYQSIQDDLRSQYLVAYQSSLPSEREGFRQVTVETSRPGIEIRTIPGYFP
ncbi:MAG: VWA domain-containing protein [Acidobacteriota bacterium]